MIETWKLCNEHPKAWHLKAMWHPSTWLVHKVQPIFNLNSGALHIYFCISQAENWSTSMIHMPIRKQSSTVCITSYLILRVDLNHWSEEILLPPFQWAKSLSLTHPDERPPKNPACCRVQKPIPRSVTKIKADHGLLKAKLAWCGLTK